MPDKDPNLWRSLMDVPPFIQGAILSFIISVLSALHESKEPNWMQILMGGLLCGALTLSLWGLSKYFGLPDELGVFVGGAIGFIGVKPLKRFLIKYLEKIISKL